MINKNLKVYGIRPVLELIESGKEIDTIYLQKDIQSDWTNNVRLKSKEYQLNIKYVPRYKLNKITSKNHQGIIAICSSIIFQNFENLLHDTFNKGEFPLFLVLDRITDVRNFGSICRSAESMGVHAVIIPTKESAQINEVSIKASAGAISNINICREESLEQVIKFAKSSGLKIIACSEKGTNNIFNTQLSGPLIIIIGSEENGVSKQLLNLSDEYISIPTSGKTQSLNASVATGIILFEQSRQTYLAKNLNKS
jgi:23S rRNA (guanosine2251-2'-O)-methyltransferase